MNLAALVAKEVGVDPQNVMLLRHSNSRVAALLREGASIEEFTLVQPIDSRYDFLASGRIPIRIVIAIVNDHVHAIYRIDGVEDENGTTQSLTSPAYARFDIKQGYLPRPAKRYCAMRIEHSRSLGQAVRGWTSPRTPVARYGEKLHKGVEVN